MELRIQEAARIRLLAANTVKAAARPPQSKIPTTATLEFRWSHRFESCRGGCGEGKKRGTCTRAEFGSEVDTSQSGGKTAYFRTRSTWDAECPCKPQNTKHLQSMVKICR